MNICENCGCGTSHATGCPHCGAAPWLSHSIPTVDRCCDTECVGNYWACQFDNPPEAFELFPGHPLDIAGLKRAMTTSRIVTFNGIKYDLPMISLALTGADNAALKALNDALIVQRVNHWQTGVVLLECDHIDLFEVAPGQGSLKAYGGKMHAQKIQDMPFDPHAVFDWPDRVLSREYCDNDLATTRLLLDAMRAQIKLREEISAEYGIDVRSKSDAQIAEAVMKKVLPFKVQIPSVTPGAEFYYRPPEWLEFVTPQLQDVFHAMCNLPFSITPSGGAAASIHNLYIDWGDKAVRKDAHGRWINKPAGWAARSVRIGQTGYTIGTGGLHSQEQCTVWRAGPTRRLLSPDVAAYYPSLIVRLGIYPPQIGPTFSSIYADWKKRRDEAKAAGNKKVANSLKTLNNGTFGKLGSQYSIFYAPSELLQVTITGQLGLLMLIERLELCGVPVISANTDGIVVDCPTSLVWMYEQCLDWWQARTGFVMETTEFDLLAARDVNSYVAITTDRQAKCKGAFAPPEPGPSGWPNPTTQICVDAVIALLRDGVPMIDTIAGCDDVRQFVSVRQVKGGGSFAPQGHLPTHTTQRAMREILTVAGWEEVSPKEKTWRNPANRYVGHITDAYKEVRAQRMSENEYLGKIVRWYYAKGSAGCILTPEGSLVAKTEGCRPLMQLPDELPADVDFDWYLAEAKSLLVDIGGTK